MTLMAWKTVRKQKGRAEVFRRVCLAILLVVAWLPVTPVDAEQRYEKGDCKITRLHWDDIVHKLSREGPPAWSAPDAAMVELVGP